MDTTQPNSTPPSSADSPRHGRLVLKVIAWASVCVVTLIALIGIGLTIALHNKRVHAYILETAEKEASSALGVHVQLHDFVLNLSNLSLDAYGITVDGAAPYSNPPLLKVDHAQVGVRIVSILHGKWYLDTLRIDRPIVRLFVDANGVSNLPKLKGGGSGNSSTTLFDLAIRRAVLTKGEVYYNDKQSVLEADLHDVEFRASFNNLLQKYSGRLAYDDGHLISGSLKPIPHNLDAEFEATRTRFELTKAQLTCDTSQLSISGTLQNYDDPIIDLSYDANLDGSQIGKILENKSLPSGLIHTKGTAHYHLATGHSVINAIDVNGELASQQLDVKLQATHSRITNIDGHYSLHDGDVTLNNFRASLLGGQLEATGAMNGVGGDTHSKLNASLHGISLQELKRTFASSASTGNVALTGTLNAQASATWGKTLNNLVAQTDATIHGHLTQTSGKGIKPAVSLTDVSVESALHGHYTASSKQIQLTNSFVRTPQTNLTMNGLVSDRSNLDLRLQADDLRELETIADLFRATPPGQTLQPLGLAGTASFQGIVTGSTASPHLVGQLVGSNLHVRGTEWKLLRSAVDVSPSRVSLQHAELDPASRGRISFDVSTGLNQWSFTQESPIQIDLNATQLNIAELTELADQKIPVSGTVNVNIKLHGTELSPVGSGSISLAEVVAYGEAVRTIKLNFTGTGDEAHGDLAVQLPAGQVQGQFSVQPKQRAYTAKLTSTGLKLDALRTLKDKGVDLTGMLTLNASGQGTFDNPQLDATLQIPRLVIQNQTISALNLRVNVANHVGNANLTSSAVNTNIQAQAKVYLSGDYMADATLNTQVIPLQPLLAVYAPEEAANISGQTEVHATLHGPLKNKNLLEAHVTIPMLSMSYGKTIQLAAASPIHVDYKNGVVDLQRASIRGTDTDLQLQGSIPTAGNAPISAMLLGTVNLQLAQLFDPDIRTSGELKFNVNSHGNGADFGGQIQIVDAAFASDDLPVGLQHGNGVLTLSKDRLSITNFQGSMGGGTLTAQGGVALRAGAQFDLGITAKDLRILYPQGVRESVDANLRLAGTTKSAVLGGSVNLSDLSFTSAFDLSSFINQFSGGVSSPPTQGFSQDLQLNLAVRSSNNVNLVSRTLSVGGSANLQVRGTAATPVILGRVNLDSGDIILNGDRFLLNGGTIEFVNPSETEPVVNLSLKTTIQQYDVYLRFNGPVDQLRTNYSSDPALPSADIINLLAFGQTTEASAASSASTTTNQAAESLVASQVSSQVTSRVSKIAGISQLSINPVLANGTSQGPAGANITIQQRVTGNLFITFSSNVASTQSQTIQGQYQLSPRVAVSATRDQNGGFAVDTLLKKSW
ncbi:translocation/assembly module TamB domain-containing protein [Acidicapsa ligni]|uniref:translocation/assembly module TamB domain-containing protein n=1 Tax=Acidicapsa ligni TaxID=542300 RepID=UPI0021E087ED|nr:translocation/assembly module TamB domain-containing protein [Acidicapsa ligni]